MNLSAASRHWKPEMKKSLADRVKSLEMAVAAQKPAFRMVTCETIYADDDEAEEERKIDAAIATDREKTGWDGKYAVFVPVSTYTKDGTWIPPGESPRRKRKEAAALAASTAVKHN